MDEQNTPWLIKILSALYIYGFANLFALGQLALVAGVYSLSQVDVWGPMINMFMSTSILTDFLVKAVIIGIIGILAGVFFFFVGLGLWNGHNWAKISGIFVGILLALLSLLYIVLNITAENKSMLVLILLFLSFAVNVFYVTYLLISRTAKEFFM